jgi:hypothetical protein
VGRGTIRPSRRGHPNLPLPPPASPPLSPTRPKRSWVGTAAAVAALVLGVNGVLNLGLVGYCPTVWDLVSIALINGALVLLLSAVGLWKARGAGGKAMAITGLVLDLVICTLVSFMYWGERHDREAARIHRSKVERGPCGIPC